VAILSVFCELSVSYHGSNSEHPINHKIYTHDTQGCYGNAKVLVYTLWMQFKSPLLIYFNFMGNM
jgi:hypothetical protein